MPFRRTSIDSNQRTGFYPPKRSRVVGSRLVNDPYFSNVSLLLHMDGANNSTTFTDNSLNNNTVTVVGNAKISTAQSKFGGASALFDGAGDYLTLPNTSTFDFTGAFTIELWVYVNTFTSPWGTAFSRYWDIGSAGYRVIVNSDQWQFSYINTSGTVSAVVGTGTSLTTWTHLALTYDGSTYRTFTNGVLGNTSVDSVPKAVGTGFAPLIGSTNTATWFFNGYIDELRITKGVARYTANFTPLTIPFSNQ